MSRDASNQDKGRQPDERSGKGGADPLLHSAAEANEKLSGHERQVHQRNQTTQDPGEHGYAGVPPGEEGQYGMRRSDAPANGPGSNEEQSWLGGSSPAPDLKLNPGQEEQRRDKEKEAKKEAEKETQGREEAKDAPRRDNPYGGDKRYEANFGHGGYGGPGVGADKD
jgi:hypothetical protein